MPDLTLTDRQVIELIKQLPFENQYSLLLEIAREAKQKREERMNYAEKQLKSLCQQRGLNWDEMSEEDKISFVDDLVQEP
jgi:Mg/Co/Ni transporter MgtE